ncbi:DUF6684 family protein [Halobaculum sp. MBLA0143]|uniref:DUF6684 family protein n=1 Tax=Halobaculum sp. MBLA0143 TaxID=3079933 RepID=UPI003524D0B8
MGRGDGDDGDSGADDGDGTDAVGLVSDLSVNVIPILILAVFVSLFWVWSPLGGEGGDPLLLFHAALIVGVVAVSAVAGWVIRKQDQPLQGTAGRREE